MTTELVRPIDVLRRYRPHDETLCGILASRAVRDPARPFLIFRDRTWSYGEFDREVARAARMLAGLGVAKGDRVAIMAPNSDSYVLLFFGLARLGAILVPINPDFGVAEAAYVLEHASVAAVAS